MTNVGDKPLHSVRGPSFCAIFRSPSQVLLMVLRSTSSTAQTRSAGLIGAMVGPATHSGALLFIQKTSLQHAEIPRFGGTSRNCENGVPLNTRAREGVETWADSCDWRRTRTTSSGVTVGWLVVSREWRDKTGQRWEGESDTRTKKRSKETARHSRHHLLWQRHIDDTGHDSGIGILGPLRSQCHLEGLDSLTTITSSRLEACARNRRGVAGQS